MHRNLLRPCAFVAQPPEPVHKKEVQLKFPKVVHEGCGTRTAGKPWAKSSCLRIMLIYVTLSRSNFGQLPAWYNDYIVQTQVARMAGRKMAVTRNTVLQVTSPELPREVDVLDPTYFCMTQKYDAGWGVHPREL